MYAEVTAGAGAGDHPLHGYRRRPTASGLHACPTDVPFFARQKKIVLENCGVIDPERIEDYIARDGYAALVTALTEMTPQEVIDQVKASGLRGRGGAGYPTGLKWSTVAKTGEQQKYVICNADEGDPGAFMDRSVLESDPHRVLEGMAIAAYAVGAQTGLHLRARRISAGGQAPARPPSSRPSGWACSATASSARRFSFDVDIRIGAGAFVCGEETALIASHRRQARHAAPAAAVPGGSGSVGQADADQQRRDLRQCRADHPQRRGVVRRHRHGEEQGHQGLRAGRAGSRTPA